jgi:hypothetical protein
VKQSSDGAGGDGGGVDGNDICISYLQEVAIMLFLSKRPDFILQCVSNYDLMIW